MYMLFVRVRVPSDPSLTCGGTRRDDAVLAWTCGRRSGACVRGSMLAGGQRASSVREIIPSCTYILYIYVCTESQTTISTEHTYYTYVCMYTQYLCTSHLPSYVGTYGRHAARNNIIDDSTIQYSQYNNDESFYHDRIRLYRSVRRAAQSDDDVETTTIRSNAIWYRVRWGYNIEQETICSISA